MSVAPRGRPRPYSVSGVFPALDGLVALLPLLDGVSRLELVDLPRALQAAARAAGSDEPAAAVPHVEAPLAELARAIWEGSAGRVDPRSVAGYWDVASRYGLLVEGPAARLVLSRRGRALVAEPEGRVAGQIGGREGLAWLLRAVGAGADGLAALLPGWRAVLAGNPRFRSPASHPRSLGQRVAVLVRGGWLAAHGDHARRLADERGFRAREPEPAFAGLGGGLTLTERGRARLTD